MTRSLDRKRQPRSWRVFSPRDARLVERQLATRLSPCCPCCGELLEARPSSRLARSLPLDATGYDLDCRECRRFWCVVRHTARSIRLLRMRRLVAAIRAVETRDDATATVSAGTAAA